jgi:hypothetical protein
VEVPRPHSRRGRWLARQRADDAAGRFNERAFVFQIPAIAGGDSGEVIIPITSQGGKYVRLLSMRGVVVSSASPSPFDATAASLQLQLNGQADMIVGGESENACSFAMLFSDRRAPWLWFQSPPLMRTGDMLRLVVRNGYEGESPPTLTPEVTFRIIDDDLWQELFTRDLSHDRLVT